MTTRGTDLNLGPILVARMDGTSASGFAPGSITPRSDVPVTRNFDPRVAPIGLADISVIGSNVYATLTAIREPLQLEGLYPAVGGRGVECQVGEHLLIGRFDLTELSLCDQPNVDPGIPAL